MEKTITQFLALNPVVGQWYNEFNINHHNWLSRVNPWEHSGRALRLNAAGSVDLAKSIIEGNTFYGDYTVEKIM